MTVIEHWRTGSHTDGHSHSAIVDAHDGSLLAVCVSVEVADLLVRVLNQQGAVEDERERIANMLARDADNDERGGFDERTRTVLRSYARTIATGGQ